MNNQKFALNVKQAQEAWRNDENVGKMEEKIVEKDLGPSTAIFKHLFCYQ